MRALPSSCTGLQCGTQLLDRHGMTELDAVTKQEGAAKRWTGLIMSLQWPHVLISMLAHRHQRVRRCRRALCDWSLRCAHNISLEFKLIPLIWRIRRYCLTDSMEAHAMTLLREQERLAIHCVEVSTWIA